MIKDLQFGIGILGSFVMTRYLATLLFGVKTV